MLSNEYDSESECLQQSVLRTARYHSNRKRQMSTTVCAQNDQISPQSELTTTLTHNSQHPELVMRDDYQSMLRYLLQWIPKVH